MASNISDLEKEAARLEEEYSASVDIYERAREESERVFDRLTEKTDDPDELWLRLLDAQERLEAAKKIERIKKARADLIENGFRLIIRRDYWHHTSGRNRAGSIMTLDASELELGVDLIEKGVAEAAL